MKREELIRIVGEEPLFTSGMLLSPGVDLNDVRKQLSRWTSDGTVVQLRRGLYALGSTYRRTESHPFELSNALVAGSYVSLESALAHHGIIPEAVFVTTAVTTGKPGRRETPLGTFVYQHIKPDLFWGYESVVLASGRRVGIGGQRESAALAGSGRTAYVATPEKALLDLAHLRAGADRAGFVRELRLQGLDTIDPERLMSFARRSVSPKLQRFARRVVALAAKQTAEFE